MQIICIHSANSQTVLVNIKTMISLIKQRKDTPPLLAIKLIVLLSVFVTSFQLLTGATFHLILIVSVSFIVYSLSYLLKYGQLQDWQLVKGKIIHIEEAEYNSPLSNKCFIYPVIHYEFTSQDQRVKSDLVSLEKENIWKETTNEQGKAIQNNEKWWSALKQGYELSVYTNPKDIKQSVLINKLRSDRQAFHLSILSSGLLLGVIWILLILLN